jgi:hypothetical protein
VLTAKSRLYRRAAASLIAPPETNGWGERGQVRQTDKNARGGRRSKKTDREETEREREAEREVIEAGVFFFLLSDFPYFYLSFPHSVRCYSARCFSVTHSLPIATSLSKVTDEKRETEGCTVGGVECCGVPSCWGCWGCCGLRVGGAYWERQKMSMTGPGLTFKPPIARVAKRHPQRERMVEN